MISGQIPSSSAMSIATVPAPAHFQQPGSSPSHWLQGVRSVGRHQHWSASR